MNEQNYEDYWKLTLEYTDFNDAKFLTTLQMIVDKIDNLNSNNDYEYSSKDYTDLQNDILLKVPKNASKKEYELASTRKAINQCVKLGFINSNLMSYNINTRNYLEAKTNKKRKTIFSKIIYANSKFNSSTTNVHNWSQINFLLKTLEEIGKLHKREVISLMLVDIEKYKNGYVNENELHHYTTIAEKSGFIERKYNQVGYLYTTPRKTNNIF